MNMADDSMTTAKAALKQYKATQRAQLRRPRNLAILAVFYAATYALVWLIEKSLLPILPHLPWIAKDWVNPDPPPHIVAFYCANLVAGFLFGAGVLLYIFCPPPPATRAKPPNNPRSDKPV